MWDVDSPAALGTYQRTVEDLVKKAKAEGSITYDDILVLIPEVDRNIKLLDDLMDHLMDAGVAVVPSRDIHTDEGQNNSEVAPQIYIANIFPEILHLLNLNPTTIYDLTPDTFELLICNRLEAMDYDITKVTDNVNAKDGGIDIIACLAHLPFTALIAIQAKHHKAPARKTGANVVRELKGVVNENSYLQSGLIVTNTRFTSAAIWEGKNSRKIMALRDWNDLLRWIRDDFTGEHIFRELPDEIEIGNGISIPRSRFSLQPNKRHKK